MYWTCRHWNGRFTFAHSIHDFECGKYWFSDDSEAYATRSLMKFALHIMEVY